MDEWDRYWGAKKEAHSRIYDSIAVFYRERIIKPALRKTISTYFRQGTVILHAGCGGGQVEETGDGIRVIGMDISSNALALYKRYHPESDVIQGNILHLGIKGESLDGIYNLGVMEHFNEDDIHSILCEFHRILKKDGTVILFWPPRYGATVLVLKGVHFFINSVLKKNLYLHPAEPSLIRSKEWVRELARESGFDLAEATFGLSDLFTYMIVVLKKS